MRAARLARRALRGAAQLAGGAAPTPPGGAWAPPRAQARPPAAAAAGSASLAPLLLAARRRGGCCAPSGAGGGAAAPPPRGRRPGPQAARALSSGAGDARGGGSADGDDGGGGGRRAPPPLPPDGAELSSAANPYVKHCVRLRESARYRQQQGRLLLAGGPLLEELAEEAGGPLEALVVFVRPGARPPRGVSAGRLVVVSESVMRKLTGLEEAAGVGVAAELALPRYVDLLAAWPAHAARPAGAAPRLLALEGVQDPGNLGTLLRCAAAFGWDAVWLLPGCCDPFNAKALRAGRGAALRWPLAAGGLPELLEVSRRRGLLLLAATPEQGPAPAPGPGPEGAAAGAGAAAPGVCLVLGTEGAGLSADVLRAATPLAVPMVGRMESLNVGVAGAILMFALSEGLPPLLDRLRALGRLPPGGEAASRARSLTEEELLAQTAMLLESSTALTAEEQMLLASGTYGNSPMGSYGGLFTEDGTDLGLESAPAPAPAIAAPAAPAAAAAAPAPKTSAAAPATKSAALMLAGAAVAVSALLL
ncbi:ysgA [Scenedesmus sp. PABB004]|nr:ysgA [Scenedesmus sp. PABB004]